MIGSRWLTVSAALALATSLGLCQTKPIDLTFKGLLRPTSRSLKPTEALLQANGKRVRITGYMARMEDPTAGGFWLCPSPVFQDESGGGTGELPPNAIFVVVRGAGKKPINYLAGALSVSGRLNIRTEAPRLTITLDSTKDIASSQRKGSRKP